MKICIYGAGAMGTSLGALLSKTGADCVLVSRSKTHVDALNQEGAYLTGGVEVIPVRACLPEELNGGYDLVLLATKQRENGEIARFLSGILAENGALVSVQNGLPEPELAQIVGADRVYGCALSWGATRTDAGRVNITSENGFHLALGAYGTGARLAEIASLLSKIGSVTTGNLYEIRFAKLAINGAFSTLSAISGLPFGTLSKRYKRQVLALMREIFAVARAHGCKRLPLNGHDLFKVFGGFWAGLLLPIAMKRYANTYSGMLADLRAGKRCEIDFISGAVVREGKRLGVPTPTQERAVALVHEIENGLAELAPESIYLLEEI